MAKRVIKKYANRRLYDSKTSKTLTLEELAELISDGEDIQIIDNETGEDITNMTLAQVIVELERGKKSDRQIAEILKDMIASGSTAMADLVQKSVSESISFFSLSRKKVQEFVDRMIKEGKVAKGEGDRLIEELWGALKTSRKTFSEKIKEVLTEKEEDFATRKEIGKLEKKLDLLEKKLSELIKKMK